MISEGKIRAVKPPKLRLWKRLTDVVIAGLLLILFAPAMTVIALVLRIIGGPVLVGRLYIGADGHPFRCWKFRSDTRLGEITHRAGLNGLPHLFSVLNGTMSLVGPHPITERERTHSSAARLDAYYACRPGLTGLWHLEPRSGVRYSERLDQRYVRECSPRLDFVILARTVVARNRD
jgi:lipopolysaccharide/colanic/teichoic acid biosynthesis glycosyltransferase